MMRMTENHTPGLRQCCAGLLLAGLSLFALTAAAEGEAKGNLVVNGKSIAITHAYAYKEANPAGSGPLTFVLLCNEPLSAAVVQDEYGTARRNMMASGKLSCVQQRIDTNGQVINFGVRDQAFGGIQPDGGSTEHLFELKKRTRTSISGRAYTKSQQMSFDDIPYSYDITFSASLPRN